jgi:hypothetical protein
LKNVNQIEKEMRTMWNPDGPDDYLEVVDREAQHGEGIIQFGDEDQARSCVLSYNGMYWKSGVIYFECIPDDYPFGPVRTSTTGGRRTGFTKQVSFFVGGLKLGFTAEDVRAMFKPHAALADVNIPSHGKGGKPATFAFVFMTPDETAKFYALHPEGFKYRGKWIKVDPKDKNYIQAILNATQEQELAVNTEEE